MFLSYALPVLSAVFFIACVLSVMSENSPSEKASSRNFFRRIRITLREIDLPAFIIVSVILLWLGFKNESLNNTCMVVTVLVFAVGLFILNSFRILGKKRTRRRKKALPALYWNKQTKEAKDLKNAPFTKTADELKEASELKEGNTI